MNKYMVEVEWAMPVGYGESFEFLVGYTYTPHYTGHVDDWGAKVEPDDDALWEFHSVEPNNLNPSALEFALCEVVLDQIRSNPDQLIWDIENDISESKLP